MSIDTARLLNIFSKASLALATRELVLHRLHVICKSDRTKTAKSLGISRPTLYRMLVRWEQHVPQKKVLKKPLSGMVKFNRYGEGGSE